MTTVAVVAHARKSFGGGLPALREVLEREGFSAPLWYEVNKSRKAPEQARRALAAGAELIFVWGGDGMVQRCVDAVAGTGTALAILPAGTANLLAANLNIPADLSEAVRVGLHGEQRAIDTGTVNGEHFAVMAGAGFDALMISAASRQLKKLAGPLAYIYAGARNLAFRGTKAVVKVDGRQFFSGRVSCLLVGNVSKVLGGLQVFPDARPDSGLLEVGLVTAQSQAEWMRALGRLATGSPRKSPFIRVTSGSRIKVKFHRAIPYELDGGARDAVAKLRIKVRPSSVRICVPAASSRASAAALFRTANRVSGTRS